MAGAIAKTFVRPRFSPLPPSRRGPDGASDDEIASLPGLIRFNATHNPAHVFCLQAEPRRRESGIASNGTHPYLARRVTFAELDRAVCACAAWIRKSLGLDGQTDKVIQPVALYMESDLGLFIHLSALLCLNVPALLLSARLSAPGIRHLLEQTHAGTLLVSQRTRVVVGDIEDAVARAHTVEPYHAFLGPFNGKDGTDGGRLSVPQVDEDNCNAMILHSSGTTGLPKPIPVTDRYLLGYAACHQFGPEDEMDWINLSTLPLYHGFGLLAPSLSLSVGMTCCFPPSSTIPAAYSTLELIHAVGAGSLMTVPSILQDILSLPDSERTPAAKLLSRLEFVAVGGGALNQDSGAKLVGHGVKLLNHYGVTEIGAIAPIFCPGPKSDYNWRYIRLRSDVGLQLRPVPNSESFRLVGHPCGWDHEFEIQDEMERNTNCPGHIEVQVLGRVDDVIVLKTGEKVMPQPLEGRLMADEAVKTAVCIGQGQFEMAVLVEPSSNAPSDLQELQDRIWRITSESNKTLDQHARISSRKAIIIKPEGVDIPRSDKGSVMRRETAERFKEQIVAAYEAMELGTAEDGRLELDPADVEGSVRRMLTLVAGLSLQVETLAQDRDLFELGIDSLQSLRLARILSSALRKVRSDVGEKELPPLTADFIYRHPSIRLLADAVRSLMEHSSRTTMNIGAPGRAATMKHVADEYINNITAARSSSSAQHTVLMTGSTGSLGAHVLFQLARTRSVTRIICLIRGSRAAASASSDTTTPNGTSSDKSEARPQPCSIESYQLASLHTAGLRDLTPTSPGWAKIRFIDMDSDPLHPASPSLHSLAGEITHILHLAWPMDFQLTLPSLRPHLTLLQSLLHLAHTAGTVRPGVRVRVVFTSSIAAVRHFPPPRDQQSSVAVVPEAAVPDPSAALPRGNGSVSR